jgi:hypothetical protein
MTSAHTSPLHTSPPVTVTTRHIAALEEAHAARHAAACRDGASRTNGLTNTEAAALEAAEGGEGASKKTQRRRSSATLITEKVRAETEGSSSCVARMH